MGNIVQIIVYKYARDQKYSCDTSKGLNDWDQHKLRVVD